MVKMFIEQNGEMPTQQKNEKSFLMVHSQTRNDEYKSEKRKRKHARHSGTAEDKVK